MARISYFVCDRCSERIKDGETEDIQNGAMLCKKCSDRYVRMWNRFMEPDITECSVFKANEQFMYKNLNGEVIM